MERLFTSITNAEESAKRIKNDLHTGYYAGEREDYMTEKIREYSMNGALIIGVDNGYGNMKTARRCFKTAIAKYDSAPVLSRDYIEYDGGYYVIGELSLIHI